MLFWAKSSTRARAVPGGWRETALCCDCGHETTFAEVEVTDKMTVFSVIEVDEDISTAFRCTECGALGELVDTERLPPGAIASLEPDVRARLLAEREAAVARERAERAEQAALREAKAEVELAALKKRMGLVEESPEAEPAGAKPSWWARLRRRS